MPKNSVDKLGAGRAAVQELIVQGLPSDDLVLRVAVALARPDISRTQAGSAIGDLLNYLGDQVPQGAQALLQEVIEGKPRVGSSTNWQEAPW